MACVDSEKISRTESSNSGVAITCPEFISGPLVALKNKIERTLIDTENISSINWDEKLLRLYIVE
ncbi:MAG: hypothetical protein JETCAE03_20370 [Ignavibacteriaceae bacterium]|nr:MAG: hypothetical protein BroJett017_19000 [Ignavibacteriota bacterium]GJQ42539.1 MAG: hypothetical protein JETCAE03_20370 [Ignavibacteriaceae bacterium]